MLSILALCTGVAACSTTAPQSYVFDEPRASDIVHIDDGHGGTLAVAKRCIDVTSPSHVRSARRYGAGCHFTKLPH
ncbi:hypothetical protein AIOL_001323 [Candidatus Rhodobacter oscarellae]|uniref:Uncharacterized protein n=2 Tax=Candidatus Rhodobacter oscarellae TaxID=1675527 RepID=A0A0J9E0A9_9RHOB|nr:hypothetical protein AIOL_001323 [Candidatus Rhodobacter lobularis]